jgi:hypothetical protein
MSNDEELRQREGPIQQRLPSPRRVVRFALEVALGASVLTGIGFGVAFTILNGWSLGVPSAILTAWLAGLYTLVNVVGLGGVAAVALMLGRRPGRRFFVAVTVAFYLLLNGALRFNPAIQPFGVVPSLNTMGAIDLAALGLVSGATFIGILRARSAWLAGAVALLLLLWPLNRWQERPILRPLPVPPASAAPPDRARPPDGESQMLTRARLVVLGFDGLTWNELSPLLERCELSGFAALLSRAAYGYLQTLPFAVSPVVWETISTGKGPGRHGIGYHEHFEFPGVDERVRRFPDFRLCNSPMGVRRLLIATDPWAPWRGVPPDIHDARAARFWEIASRSGLSVGVYNWLNTAPAVPIHGFLHAWGLAKPLDYPLDLEAGLPALKEGAPGMRPGIDWARTQLSVEQDNYRRFVTLALRHQPEVLLFYTHFADTMNHLNWKSETVGDGFFFSGLGRPRVEPGPTLTLGVRFLDQIVTDVRARMPEDATLVIVSDHGFDFRGYEHDNAPPGVFLAAGPGIRPGVVEGARVVDVTPTLLDFLDLPVADDMEGRLLPVARPGGRFDRAVAHVKTYGPAAVAMAAPPGRIDPKELREYQEYLRALGYIN